MESVGRGKKSLKKLFNLLLKGKSERWVQFIKFGFVGLGNTVVSYVVYAVLIYVGVHYLAAGVAGFVASVTNAFYWNNKYVFGQNEQEERNLIHSFIKIVVAYAGTGLILASMLLYIWIDIMNLPELLGPILNLMVTVPLNFLLNKFWVFKSKHRWRRANDTNGIFYDKDTILELLFLLVAFCFMMYFLPLGVDSHHDGYVFNMALTVRRGGVIYQDWHNIYGPLTAYTQAAFMAILGDSLWVMRFSAIPFYLLSFWMVYIIFRRWVPKKLIVICQMMLLLSGTGYNTGWSSIYALAFSMIATHTMLYFIETGKIKWCVASGAAAVVTFFYRQPVGIVIALAGLCTFVYYTFFETKNIRKLFMTAGVYLLSMAASIAPVLLVLAMEGSLQGWWYDNILYMFQAGGMTGFRSESLGTLVNMFGNNQQIAEILSLPGTSKLIKFVLCMLPVYPFNSQLCWVILPVVSLITFVRHSWCLWKKGQNDIGRKKRMLAGIVSIYAIASWAQYYPSSNHFHWFVSSFLMYGILIMDIYDVMRGHTNRLKAGVITGGLVCALMIQPCYFSYVAKDTKDISATLLGDTTLNNKLYSMQYHSEVYRNEKFPYLNGMHMSPKQVEFYDDVLDVLEQIQIAWPEKKIEMHYPPVNLLAIYALESGDTTPAVIIAGYSNKEQYSEYTCVYERQIDYKSESYLEQEGDKIAIFIHKDD